MQALGIGQGGEEVGAVKRGQPRPAAKQMKVEDIGIPHEHLGVPPDRFLM